MCIQEIGRRLQCSRAKHMLVRFELSEEFKRTGGAIFVLACFLLGLAFDLLPDNDFFGDCVVFMMYERGGS